jgi:DNA-binding transcriptional ArsR family regulator
MDPELLTSLKALSDASRLRIVGLLADGRRMAVEQLAAALELTPATVVHHLKKLREAGLVESHARPPYMDYSLKLGRLSEIGGSLHRIAREQTGAADIDATLPDWATPADAKVLRAFFDGERLTSIPAQHSKRLVVLRRLAESIFEKKRKYPEREVNQLLAVRHPDAASLRRYLVDEGFMARKQSVYRLLPRREWPRISED